MQMRPHPVTGRIEPVFTKGERNRMLTQLAYIAAIPDEEVQQAIATIRKRVPLLSPEWKEPQKRLEMGEED